MDILLNAIGDAFAVGTVIATSLGLILGVTVGAIPGLGGTMAIALLLPLVYQFSPGASLGMLLGIYKGSMFGGSIAAISFGIPGTPAAAAVMEDGHKAKLNGQPNRALKTALYSSVTGDVFSDVVLIAVAVPMARIAVQFGPVEFFALYVFALLLIALLVQGAVGKGLASAAIGMFIGSIGMDPMMGTTRYMFGISQLRGGVPMVPLLIGIFALSELLVQIANAWVQIAANKMDRVAEQASMLGYDASKDNMTFKIYLSTLKATMIGAGIGTFVGALPGAGSTLAAYLGYGMARRFSRHSERFGSGSLEGVAAPEAANSATAGSTFIPLFAFGIPGSALAALFAVALIMQGITPGPRMISEHRLVIYTLFVILIYANFLNLFLSTFLIPVYARLSMIKPRHLAPAVLALAIIGTYASRNSVIDVWLALLAGLLGVVLKKGGFPLGPLVLGYIIGPGAERALRQALLMGGGDWSVLFSRPIAIGLYAATAMLLLLIRKNKGVVKS